MSSLANYLAAPFRREGGADKTLVCVFVLLNGIVLANACLHDPGVGYDSAGHLRYVESLARLHLPTPQETHEYFSPPLPYAFPALLVRSGLLGITGAAKCAQLLNALLSVGLTFYLLKICDLVRPDSSHLKVASLLLLALLTAYYKTFAFVRGEPFVAFFAVVVAHRALLIFHSGAQTKRHVLLLGVALGLLVLSRQWGFLLFPAVIAWCGISILKKRQGRGRSLSALAAALAVSFLVGGWFYLHLLKEYGSVASFARDPTSRFAFSNQPREFYLGLGSEELFTDPVRPSFPNRLTPLFYTEMWGDYWCLFVVYGKDARTGAFVSGAKLGELTARRPPPEWLETNRFEVNAYLARVNCLSLFPTALYLAGLLFGAAHLWRFMRERETATGTAAPSLCALLVACSLVGYLWFLIRFPNPGKGDTIKATYMLQIFPFVAVLSGAMLDALRRRSKRAYAAALALLTLIFAHNLPALITRYVP